jgi:hypothetical protein
MPVPHLLGRIGEAISKLVVLPKLLTRRIIGPARHTARAARPPEASDDQEHNDDDDNGVEHMDTIGRPPPPGPRQALSSAYTVSAAGELSRT